QRRLPGPQDCSNQSPSVPIEKSGCGSDKHYDVPPSFSRGVSAVMYDFHVRKIHDPADLRGSQADIGILIIEKKTGIKTGKPLQHIFSEQHAATACHGGVPVCLFSDNIAHFIVIEACPKPCLYKFR